MSKILLPLLLVAATTSSAKAQDRGAEPRVISPASAPVPDSTNADLDKKIVVFKGLNLRIGPRQNVQTATVGGIAYFVVPFDGSDGGPKRQLFIRADKVEFLDVFDSMEDARELYPDRTQVDGTPIDGSQARDGTLQLPGTVRTDRGIEGMILVPSQTR